MIRVLSVKAIVMILGVERLLVGGGREEAHSNELSCNEFTIGTPQVHASLTGAYTLTTGDTRPTADGRCK